jgi:catechol 2,3-dioxygenase-like lactoylglutathione lyase family enzyme
MTDFPTNFAGPGAMFDHVVFGVSDYAASKAFFLEALAPLGGEAVCHAPEGGA